MDKKGSKYLIIKIISLLAEFSTSALTKSSKPEIAAIAPMISNIATSVSNVNDIIYYINSEKERKNIIKTLSIMKERLDELNGKISKLNDGECCAIDQIILPEVLKQAKAEDEEKKIDYIVNGFFYCIDNKIFEKDMILLRYDILRQLRALDIKMILSFNETGGIFIDKTDMDISIPINYIYHKLARLNIFNISYSVSYLSGNEEKLLNADQIKISKFGKEFIKFISNNELKSSIN